MEHTKKIRLSRALFGAQEEIQSSWCRSLEAHRKLRSRKGLKTKQLLSTEMQTFLTRFLGDLEIGERRGCEDSLGRMARLFFQVELPHTILAQTQISLKRILIREVIRSFQDRAPDIRDMCNFLEAEIDRNRIFLANEFEKLALATLAASEKNYRELIEDMEDMVFRLNNEGKIIFANSACMRIFGIPAESFLGKSMSEHLHPTGRPDFHRSLEEVFSRHRKVELLSEIRGVPEGKVVHFRMYPMKAEDGRVTGVRGIARDVSHAKKLEVQLGRANAMLDHTNLLLESKAKELLISQRILEGISEKLEPESIIHSLAIPLQEIVSFTSLTLFVLGGTRNTIITQENPALYRHEKDLILKEIVGELKKTRMVDENALLRQPEEYFSPVGPCCDERPGQAAALCFPLIAEDALIGAVRIADRRRHSYSLAEKNFLKNVTSLISLGLSRLFSMREYKRRMGEVTRMKSDFGSLVSHELRTPLTSLRNVVDILLSGKLGVLEPRQSHLLSIAKKDTVRLWGLIANILDLSKLESGSTLLVQGEIQVREFLMSVMGRIRDQAREKGIVLEARVSRCLPRLSADPERLEQIIVNLLSNAIRFSPSGGKIRVSARLIPDLSSRVPRARRLAAGWNASSVMHNGCGDGGSTHELPAGIHFVEISVRDWGMGISPARLDAIFDKYSQADPVMTRTSTGIGLGLTITRHLTLAHKGLIWVESREGAGSVFRCLLPVQGEEPSTAVHSNSTTPRA